MQEPIAFEGLLVIVGGGSVDGQVLVALAARGAHFVGADAGGDVIAEAGLHPDAIIGDFDSLNDPDAWEGRTELRQIAEQDSIDFEKALYSTTAPLTVALGMTGDRFDHTLAALDAVTRQARGRKIILVDEHDLALALTGPFAFEVDPGDRVSIHPLMPVTFAKSDGLMFKLDGLTLAMGLRVGMSNSATDGPFTIEPEVGSTNPWLVIVRRSYLLPLIDRLLA